MKTTPLHHTHEQLGARFAKTHQDWQIAAEFMDTVAEHHTVRNSVGIVDVSYRSRHQLTGEDRAKFLNRIISNDVENLAPGQGTYATLLTHRGKIIADLNIYILEDAILMDTAPETAEKIFSELDKYIIADDVELSNLTSEMGAIAVHGPKSAELVQSLLSASELAALLERHSCVCSVDALFEHPIICVRTDATGEVGYTLYTATGALVPLWEALMTQGAQFNVQPIGWNALESLRIEAGIPRYGTELTDTVIPLEAEIRARHRF